MNITVPDELIERALLAIADSHLRDLQNDSRLKARIALAVAEQLQGATESAVQRQIAARMDSIVVGAVCKALKTAAEKQVQLSLASVKP
jgi:anti-anti-sigma regulatory factor